MGSLLLLREGGAAYLQGIRRLSLETGEEGMSDDSSHNMQSDLYKVELRLSDLLDVEEHLRHSQSCSERRRSKHAFFNR